ncbi:PREDICTED: uncharacterized protein LOC109344656 [Lupinus angustifolius]|uniref:uncharacterized protein LOC109344656 n=1 Tax=Lupinus angustifolius TaxID=3871 RepID=UPI00092FA6C2|nr:PREDICTED: uncharacterized protein LOC109344656 [Lupinus angustifolius]
MNQRKYALETLSGIRILGCKPSSTPMTPVSHVYQDSIKPYTDPPAYRRLIGAKVLRCIKGTPVLELFFPISYTIQLKAYNDSDWAAYPDTRRSITGFCICLGNSLVSWKSKKQRTASISSL